MHSRFFGNLRRLFQRRSSLSKAKFARPSLECLEGRSLLSANVVQANLISDIAGFAATRDARLVNPWGIAAGPTSPFCVSDSGTGHTTLFSGHGQIVRQTVNMPTNPA